MTDKRHTGQAAKPNKFKEMFSSLKYRNFRLVWSGTVISTTGDFIEIVALNWLVYQLTSSALYLGIFNLTRSLPILFLTLIAGTLADKYDRRMIMIYSQGTAMVLSAILAFMAFTDSIGIVSLIIIGSLQGIANSFNLPIRQSLIPELVPRERIANAIALNGASFTMTLVLGPAFGGILVGAFGVPWALLINTFTFIAVLWALFSLDIPRAAKKHEQSVLESLKEGIVYLVNHKIIFTILIFYMFMTAIGLPYNNLLPVFAQDFFSMGATGYGFLWAAAGIGAVLGSMAAGIRKPETLRKTMILGVLGFGIFLALFGILALYIPQYIWIFYALLLLIGFAQLTYIMANNTAIQLLVEDKYRGRVVSTIFLGFGLTSLGSILMGVLAELYGAPGAFITIGAVIVVAGGLLTFYSRGLVMHA